MSEAQGYFSLVQYSEIPERAEFVNIGVILFASALPHVLSKFSQRPRRAEKAFGVCSNRWWVISPGKKRVAPINYVRRLATAVGFSFPSELQRLDQ